MSSVACRYMRDHPDKMRYRSFKKIHSFSVGLEDSPDLLVGPCIPYVVQC